MITNGQARRIAGEWQAPHTACSALQHIGLIRKDLIDELEQNMLSPHNDADSLRELAALKRWAKEHGPGRVTPWGAWSDKPAR